MDWNVLFFDDETGTAYRVRVKRLTVGDAVHADMLGDDIARRDSVVGRELLTLSQVYPFVRYATAESERAVPETTPERTDAGEWIFPDDLTWEPFDLTEAVFMGLPEWFILRWQHEAIMKNPHRDPTYEALKKKWLRERLQTSNTPPTNDASNSATPNANESSNA